MYTHPSPPWFDLAGQIAGSIADELARRRQRQLRRPPIPRGKTLRPGADTPCWNQLVARVAPLLRKRGAKALLARELGLHRARMTDFFVNRSAMPDAERLLRLFEWLALQAAEARRRADAQAALDPDSSPASAASVPATRANVRNTNIR